MGKRNRQARQTNAVAGGVMRIIVYIAVISLIIWIGKSTYNFGYAIFNQKAMSPENGQEVTVVIKEGTSVYGIGKTLEKNGLIEDAKVFVIQEKLSDYKGKIQPGTYVLSTAYTPNRILAVLAGEESEEETP